MGARATVSTASRRWSPCNRQTGGAANGERRLPLDSVGGELEVRETGDQAADRLLSLGPGQRRAETGVDPAAERQRQLPVVLTADVEPVRVVEHVRVTVGARDQRNQ